MTGAFIPGCATHVRFLAQRLGCQVRQIASKGSGMMYVEFGYVEAPVIRDQEDYMVNLHELGHFAHGHTQGRPPKEDEKFYFENGVLRSEAQAWEWALDNAVGMRLTPATRRFMWDRCLSSYYRGYLMAGGKPGRRMWNGNRHHVRFTYDKPDDYFGSVVRRIQNGMAGFRVEYRGAGRT